MSTSASAFSRVAAEVHTQLARKISVSAVNKDAEWQRVNSYIADTLKDSAMLYSKLARLQGDFVGEELDRLKQISEVVLTINEELSGFSKAFNEGKLDMAESVHQYGNEPGGDEMFQPFDNSGEGEITPELPEGLDTGEEETYDEEPEEKPESEKSEKD